MISPPLDLKEFLVFKPAVFPEYEIFSFPFPIREMLDNYATGKALTVPDGSDEVEYSSWIFQDISLSQSTSDFIRWLQNSNIADAIKIAKAASSWRLVYVVRGEGFEVPTYQGHPVITEDWKRVPSVIDKQDKPKVDIFDPLTKYLSDSSFYDLDHLR